MPIYDYVCAACGHRMEVMHGVHGHGPSACPICGAEMRKAFAAPAVHFKGTGWAKKERSSAARKAKASKPAEPGADAGSGGTEKPVSDGSGASSTTSPSSDASTGKD